jgi:hypothetical protein
MFSIYPLKLFVIEDDALIGYVGGYEILHLFVVVEDLLIDRPTEKGQVIHKTDAEIAFTPEVIHTRVAVSFGKRRAVTAQDQRNVHEDGMFPAQRPVHHYLARRVREMIFPSEDMSDLHEMIVDDHGKIVSRVAVRLDYDEVTEVFILEAHVAFREIKEFSDTFGYLEF